MTKLTNTVALISRANKAARLTAIDVEAQTCIIFNGTEKVINWNSAAAYKLDTGSDKTRTLTPKFLTALAEAEKVHHSEADSTPSLTDTAAPVSSAQDAAPVVTPDTTKTVVEAKQETAEQPTAQKPMKINDTEKLLLATIPQLPDFKGVDSVMNGRNFLKKAEELHGISLKKSVPLFKVLRDKGFYSAKAKESGQNRTTFQLSVFGIQYLTENGLLAVV